jgi:hypothetical protein
MQTVNMASLFKLQAKTTFNPQLSVSHPVLWKVSWWDPPKTLKNIHINSDWVTKHGNATDVANKLAQINMKMDMSRTCSTYK